MPKTTDRLAPDWGHWLNMASVTVDEAIHLTLNVDPRINTVKEFASSRGLTRVDGPNLKARLAPYADRLNQSESAFFARHLLPVTQSAPLPLDRSRIRIELQSFIKWVTTLTSRWDLPTELESLGSTKPPSRDNPREIASYQKILIALVVKHYSYDPSDQKSTVTSRVRDRLNELDLFLDDETIRKCLKNSARHLK